MLGLPTPGDVVAPRTVRRSQDHQRRVEELRRSNAAAPHVSRKAYSRKRKHRDADRTS